MLNLFRMLSLTSAVVLAVLVVASLFVHHAWCRYLCPYGALLGWSPWRAPANPAHALRLHRLREVVRAPARRASRGPEARDRPPPSAARCLSCVAACPAAGALALSAPGPRRVPALGGGGRVVALLMGVSGLARALGAWGDAVPDATYRHLVPQARLLGHP
jgi:hypothetical protein